jgi:hypothetical protein
LTARLLKVKLAIAMPMFLVAATKNPQAIEAAIADLGGPYYDLKPDLFVFPYGKATGR